MLIDAKNLSFGYLDETLLESVCFSINEGDRVGLIGGNGEGKTTLLKLILGALVPNTGSLFVKNGISVGYLAQSGGYDGKNTVLEEMLAVFDEDKKAIEELRKVELEIALANEGTQAFTALSARYEYLNKKIAARDSYTYEIRVRTVLNGMGFENAYHQNVATLSGGEKTRLNLCKLLLKAPDLLILDEPTNHLDVKTLFWLEEYLTSYKGAILLVSHDRYFLDKTVRTIFEIENKRLSVFKGNYTKYKVLKAEKTAHLLKEYEKQQEERAHLQDFVDRNLYKASKAKSAQDRIKKLEKMTLIEKPPLPPTPPKFTFSFENRPAELTLQVDNLRLTAGEKTLLENVSLEIRRGEKCAVVGENGTGKSSLLKTLIAGKNPAVKWGRYVRLANFDQEMANLSPDKTPLEELWEKHVLWGQTEARALLARVGLKEEDIFKKNASLSGGEKVKLSLALLEGEEGNVLILDEPTNHLDLAARESLEEALKAFDGTLIFVSHDRYFINALAGKILELEKGKLTVFPCGYDEFLTQKQAKKEEIKPVPAPTVQKNTGYRGKDERAQEARRQTRIKQIEKQITALEEEENAINEDLAKPEVSSDFTLLSQRCNRLEEIKNSLDALYEEYETLL
ncbi:MAG: ABC-F family ATP-binding cassette domain-containing protein [Clostridia bacterium]|nr:ABC-F family ATP-binding cassette domain-containing protein [Clostridia bacterium]